MTADGFAGLLPARVVVKVAAADNPTATLRREEESAIAAAVPQRRAEFATTRHLARLGLSALGREPAAIPVGPHGEPVWPEGIVGSLTHCQGLRAAALAPSDSTVGVGIDAEPNRPLPAGVLGLVATDAEALALGESGAAGLGVNGVAVARDRLLFSAKEASFKLLFPLTGLLMKHSDLEISLRAGRFAARLNREADRAASGLALVRGRWCVAGGLLLTAAYVGRR